MVKEEIARLMREEKIELFSFLSLDECRIKKKYLLDRVGISRGSVIIMAVPYASSDLGKGNISEYAKGRDYHIYFSSLFERMTKRLADFYPDNRFAGFSDHSPIDEIHAAALAGLGVIGQNRLLLTEKYSSFVFLGELITDLQIDSDAREIEYCQGCEKCLRACPSRGACLSSITQKKGTLEEWERELIRSCSTAWGCDLCQLVCPYTLRAIENQTLYTSVPFFLDRRIGSLTHRDVASMSDGHFAERAYSWRGRETILRNLAILEACSDTDKNEKN